MCEIFNEKSYTSLGSFLYFLSRLCAFLMGHGSSKNGKRLFFFSRILHPKEDLGFGFFLREKASCFVILKLLRDFRPCISI